MKTVGSRMKNKIWSQAGATSVLVVLMMSVLVTLGAFAISAAHANYVLGRKSLSWNVSYYKVEAMAEQFLRDVDGQLLLAEQQLRAGSGGDDYLSRAQKGIDSLAGTYRALETERMEADGAQQLRATMNFKLPEEDFMLLVVLEIPSVEAATAGKRYEITTWKQWQQPFEMEKPIEFWDGAFE